MQIAFLASVQSILPGSAFALTPPESGVGAKTTPVFTTAQVLEIPPTLEPTRPQENLREGPRIQSTPQKFVPLTREEAAPENAAATAFVFREMTLEGAEALAPEALLALWSIAPGETASVADVFRFANAITRAYAQAGYALSFAVVPEQNIENGVVAIRVIEGFVDRIEFVGDKAERLKGGRLLRRAHKTASKILRSRPLRTADLERYVLLVNDLPGLEVSTTLKPSADATGAATLALEVERRAPLRVGLAYNNYMPASLERHVAGVSAGLNGVVTGAEEISFSGWHSATSEAYRSASGSGSLRIGNEGLRVGVSGSYSESSPQTAFLEALEYLGETTSGAAFVSYPVIRRRTKNLVLSTSFSVTNSSADVLDAPFIRDRVRSAGASIAYDFADATRAVTYMRVGYERGLDIFNATGDSRANGELEYNVVNVDAQRTQPVMEAFSGNISVQIALRGQGAFGPGGLYSNVECALGGRRFGRGYDSGVLTGEHCALGYGELAWSGRAGPVNMTIYGFGDGGYLWQKGQLEPGEIRRRSAASAGAGLRVQLTKRVSGVAETSWAVRPPTGAANTDQFRVNAGLRASF